MRPLREILVSVILPLEDTGPFITQYLDDLSRHLAENFDYYETLAVNNASRDQTAEAVAAAQGRFPNITFLELTRRMNISVATVVGLDHSIGDLVVILDPRLDPPDLVARMVAEAAKGFEIVYAIPNQHGGRRSFYERMESLFLRFVSRVNGIEVPPTFPSARLFSRTMLNFLLQAVDRHLILSLAPSLSGHPAAQISYDRTRVDALSGARHYSWRRSITKAIELTLAISPRPLRIVSITALFACGLAIVYSVYAFVLWLFSDDVMPGWTSLSLQISGLFFFVCLLLAMMSEYLQQILESVERRPLYLVKQHSESKVMSYGQELNVVEKTTPEETTPKSAP